MRTPCAACRGAGIRKDDPCSHCNGQGYYFDRRCPRCGELREREAAAICDGCAKVVAQNVGNRGKMKRGPSH